MLAMCTLQPHLRLRAHHFIYSSIHVVHPFNATARHAESVITARHFHSFAHHQHFLLWVHDSLLYCSTSLPQLAALHCCWRSHNTATVYTPIAHSTVPQNSRITYNTHTQHASAPLLLNAASSCTVCYFQQGGLCTQRRKSLAPSTWPWDHLQRTKGLWNCQ